MKIIQDHLIRKTISSAENLDRVRSIVLNNQQSSLKDTARIICQEFGFIDAKGNLQIETCSNALIDLDKREEMHLTLARHYGNRNFTPKCLNEAVPDPQNLPEDVRNFTNLALVLVETPEELMIWNTLMEADHPLGAGKLVGRQVRYLISSDQGWLGGLGFASSALKLEARDKWIGWDDNERATLINNIVGLSRFLIRKSVHCQNLASKVLGMAIKQMPIDFEHKYGYRPVLIETFVGNNEEGTCYKASNWIEIGKTKGVGRYRQLSGTNDDVKTIFVYELYSNFRELLNIQQKPSEEKKIGVRGVDEGLNSNNWVENEFGSCPLGDIRRTRRLQKIVQQMSDNPSKTYCNACGNKQEEYAFLEFIENKSEDINMDSLRSNHLENTDERINGCDTVVHAVDKVFLNYNHIKSNKELGSIAKFKNGNDCNGLEAINVLALNAEGQPLGLVNIDIYAPKLLSDEEKQLRKKHPNQISLEDKKTFKWIQQVDAILKIQEKTPNTTHVYVADRESDFFDIYLKLTENAGKIQFVIRVANDRCITNSKEHLYDFMRNSEKKGTVKIKIPKDNNGSKERESLFGMYAQPITLKPPRHKRNHNSITMNCVYIKEETPLEGEEPIEWFLFTSLPIQDVEEILLVLKIYKRRWRIEEWHKVLKSVCKVESLTFRTFTRLSRVIVIKMIIAWRIMLITLLGRECSDISPDVVFSNLEIELINSYAKLHNTEIDCNMGSFVEQVAIMGGYIKTKHSQSGFLTTARGLEKLKDFAYGAISILNSIEKTISSHIYSTQSYNELDIFECFSNVMDMFT